jgi:hypothetical protein
MVRPMVMEVGFIEKIDLKSFFMGQAPYVASWVSL